jgi:phosphonate transport system permease protein
VSHGAVPVATGAARARERLPELHGRGLLTVLLIASLAWSLLQVDPSDGLVRTNGLRVFGDLVRGVLTPDLSWGTVSVALRAGWITAVYAIAGLTLALILGLPLGIVASGTLWRGGRRRLAVVAGTRALLGALRAVHELVWAWLFVAAIGLSPFAAAFALALPYAGILGRIYADLLNDVPEAPLRALRSAGARESQVLLVGRLPQAAADMVSYSFYRFECALRSAAIMGFVGLGGLGFQIEIALDDLEYGAVGTYLLVLIALIAGVEAWSNVVRRELTR